MPSPFSSPSICPRVNPDMKTLKGMKEAIEAVLAETVEDFSPPHAFTLKAGA